MLAGDVRTIRLLLQYDGREFVGWQRQERGVSIQGTIEDALAKIDGGAVTLHGAGRTDAGVHALGQVASARMNSPLDDETLARALNANLPPAVRVVDVATVADDFHARFSARSKTYEYRIWNGAAIPPFIRQYAWHVPQRLAVDVMQQAANAFIGEHDFAAFQGTGSTVHTTVRTVTSARWIEGEPNAGGRLLSFEMSGAGFLRHMVRAVTGTLIEIGLGRRAADDIPRLLASRDRSQAGRTAPACGLFLMRVEY